MDEKIRKIEKDVKRLSKTHLKKHDEKKMQHQFQSLSKELKSLEKMDIKRDKFLKEKKKKSKKK